MRASSCDKITESKMSQPTICCVSGCFNASYTEGVNLFHFPSNPEFSSKWVDFTKSEYIRKFSEDKKRCAKSWKICSLHFRDTDFTSAVKIKLRRGSIPSIFCPEHPAVEAAAVQQVDSGETTSLPLPTSSIPHPLPSTSFTEIPSPISDPSITSFSSPNLSSTFRDVTSTPLPDPSPCVSYPSSSTSLPLTPSTPTSRPACKRKRLVLSDIGISRREYCTPRKRLLFRYAKQKESEVERLRASYEKVRRRAKKIMATENQELSVVDFLKSMMTEDAALFLSSQVRCSKKKPKGRRWTMQEKIVALSIYKQSPKSYRFLRSIIALPCTRTLKSILSTLPFTTGIDHQALSFISQYLNQGEACDRMCVLMFDEMSLKPHFDYRAKPDLIVGFEDHGHLGRNSKCAKYALVFMVRGLLQKWKQPISVYFSSSPTKSEVLVSLTKEVLQQCHKAGLCVTAIVCDMGTNNVKTLKTMGSSPENPIIHFEGKEIVTIFDPPHLLKSTRNLLMKHDIKLQVNTGSLQFEGVASWRDVVDAYMKDKEQTYAFRFLYKLTEANINPKGRSKMRVILAAQILSRTMATYLMSGVSNGFLPQKAIGTAHFVEQVNSMFDSVNGGSIKVTDWKGPVTDSSGHAQFWAKAIEHVKSWKLWGENGPLPQPPSFRGWITTLRGMMLLWDRVKVCKRGRKFVGQFCPHHVNQDALENLFGCLRALGGSNRDPTVSGFMDSWRTCIINGLSIGDVLKGMNCQSDGASLLSSHNPNLEDAGVAPLQDSAVICEAAAVSVSVALDNLSCNSPAEVCRTLARDSLVNSSCDECRNGLWSTSPAEWTLPLDVGDQQQYFPCENLIKSVAQSMNFGMIFFNSSATEKEIFRRFIMDLETGNYFQWVEGVCAEHGLGVRAEIEKKIAYLSLQSWCRERNRQLIVDKL